MLLRFAFAGSLPFFSFPLALKFFFCLFHQKLSQIFIGFFDIRKSQRFFILFVKNILSLFVYAFLASPLQSDQFFMAENASWQPLVFYKPQSLQIQSMFFRI